LSLLGLKSYSSHCIYIYISLPVPMVRLGSWVASMVPSLVSLFTSIEFDRGMLTAQEVILYIYIVVSCVFVVFPHVHLRVRICITCLSVK
jgi:hypothetical protein